ncbi:hypothetical protein L2719_10305 [Shewanella schlegeliana]|uniref:Uncharacterized protein n=1 Tax=Shewanella schlegeliana TaxID=190308 RepID=A0ABS1T1Q6_9GAMM|nr:hypothetical protein [Shewanella schlegeliana]MBL4914729.1 hypothetical protein [Shewanella schlegeliana]MCL1109939.1 hypothetical protein [Shewanella schlegeliana]GIU25562.1 hypothetical protein TUM4433_10470 [Shewanella schlegeliana]
MSVEFKAEEKNTFVTMQGDAFAGDKVNGDKYCIENHYQTMIQQLVPLESMRSVLNDILTQLTSGKREQAEQTLDMLSKLGSLSLEAQNAIIALKISFGFKVSDSEKSAIQQAYSNLPTSINDYDAYRDIVNAAAIILFKDLKKPTEVAAVFKSLPTGSFTTFSYIRSLDRIDSVEELPIEIHTANAPLLRVILDKTLESSAIKECQKLINLLREKEPFAELGQYELLVECINLNEIAVNDFFLLTSEQKQVFDDTKFKLLEFCQQSTTPESRMISIAAQLAIYTQFNDQDLMSYLVENKKSVEKMTFRGIEELLRCLDRKAASEYRNSLHSMSDMDLSKLITQPNQEECNGILISEFCSRRNTKLINQTLSELISLGKTPDNLGYFCMLAAHASSIISKEEFPLESITEIFNEDFSKLRIHSTFIAPISMELAKGGYKELALIAFNHTFEGRTPWLSDMYISYLGLLYENAQYHDFNTRLNFLTSSEKKHSEIINLEICIANDEGNYQNAVNLLEIELRKFEGKILSKHDKRQCTYLWLHLIVNIQNINPEKINSIVERIPISIFYDHEDENAWDLLTFFTNQFHLVEELLLSWFFYNPNKYANRLFKVVMNTAQSGRESFSTTKGRFSRGYQYTEDKISKIRILVNDLSLANDYPQYLLFSDSELAKKLAAKKTGDSFLHKAKLCIFEDSLPPIISAYRIAIKIMDHDENQVFTSFQMPEKFNYESFKEILDSVTGKNEPQDQKIQQLLKGNFPVHLKYSQITGHNSFAKALKAILSKNVYFDLIGNNELEDIKYNLNDIVLDEIGFAFLAITGLGDKLKDSKLHITSETRSSITAWLTTYGDLGISFSKDRDEFISIDNKNVQPNFDLRREAELLLTICQTHNKKNYNTPFKLVMYTGFLLSSSTVSSLGLANTNNWAFFTPDFQLRAMLRKPEFKCILFSHPSFADFLFKDTPTEQVSKLIQLQEHNFNLFVPWATIFQMCSHATPVQINSLEHFLSGISVKSEEVLALCQSSSAIIMRIIEAKTNNLNFTDFNNILEKLLIKTLEAAQCHKAQAKVILELLPISLAEECYLDIKSIKLQKLLLQIAQNVTNEYIEIINSCLHQLKMSKVKVWNEVERICEDEYKSEFEHTGSNNLIS